LCKRCAGSRLTTTSEPQLRPSLESTIARHSISTGTRCTQYGGVLARLHSSWTSPTGPVASTSRTEGSACAPGASASSRPTRGSIPALDSIGHTGPISVDWGDARMHPLEGTPVGLEYVRSLLWSIPIGSFHDASVAKD
jgi:hypothetical protein